MASELFDPTMRPKQQNKPQAKTKKSHKDYPLAGVNNYQDLLYLAKNIEDQLYYSEGKNSAEYQKAREGLTFLQNNKGKIDLSVRAKSDRYNPSMVLTTNLAYPTDSVLEPELAQVKSLEQTNVTKGMLGYSISKFMGIHNLSLLHQADHLFTSDSSFSRYILKLNFNKNCKKLDNMNLYGYRNNTSKVSNLQFVLDHYLMMMERSPEGCHLDSYPEWVKTHIEMYQNSLLLQ